MTPRELALFSRGWSGRSSVQLVVQVPSGEALVVGAFERAREGAVRRGSGGASAHVGPGSVWLSLSLPSPDALVPCTADQLLNRYVRPLLRALTKATRLPASYFGRDWISMKHRPVGLVAFAHEAATGRSLFEAFVAVSTPFATTRSSFLGKPPATLEELAGRSLDPATLARTIAEAYGIADAAVAEEPVVAEALEPPWSATREEAIGTIAAGRDASGRLRLGGELMASRDAVHRLEDGLTALPEAASMDAIGALVDDAFTTRGAVLFGVRSLASIRDVLVEARRIETRRA